MNDEAAATRAADEPLTAVQQDLLAKFRDRKRLALARIISLVENGRPGFHRILHEIHPHTHRARRIGITGPPGAGKSTITAGLIERFRARGETVGVIAVDPTSPYTGGALLGDRIRMNEVAQDDGVFIRSMATRGALGGLAAATREVMDVLAAYGFDVIIVETVGVGQSELDIAAAADTTAVVLVPESGDSIQTMKAGLMEAADLFVVNKADRPGAPRLAKEVEMMLHLRLGEAMKNIPAHHGVRHRPRAHASTTPPRGEEGPPRRPAPPEGGETGQARDPAPSLRGVEGKGGGRSSLRAADGEGGAPAVGAGGRAGMGGWTVPVLLTTAETGAGMDELVGRLDDHGEWLRASGELERRRRSRLQERVRDAVQQALLVRAWQEGEGADILASSLESLAAGEATPYEVAARIVRAVAG